MTSNHHAPYDFRLHTCYNGWYNEQRTHGEGVSRHLFSVQRAQRSLHEAGIAGNRGSARRGEPFPGPCTPPVTTSL